MSDISALSNKSHRGIFKAVREAYGEKPIDVHAQNVIRTAYYKEYLYRLICGQWDWDIPKELNWNLSYLQQNLILLGGFAVAKYKGALLQVPFSILERTIQHLPHKIASVDGEVDLYNAEVGADAEIVTLGYRNITCTMYTYAGIIDIFSQRLANCDASIDINLLNTRAPFLFECFDAGEAEDMKALYTRISEGEPAVYWRSKRSRNVLEKPDLPITILPIKENYIADMILSAKRDILAEFKTCIGITNVDYEKKERLVSSEADANIEMTETAVKMWNDNVKSGCEAVKNLFGIDLDIKIKEKKTNVSTGLARSISDDNTERHNNSPME